MSKSFYKIYNGLLRLPQYSQYPRFPGVGLAYDTIWSLAMGLEEASKTVSSLMSTGAVASADHHFDECYGLPGEIVPLEQFDYNNQKMGCIFRQSMEKVEFSGVTVSSCSYILDDNDNNRVRDPLRMYKLKAFYLHRVCSSTLMAM